MLTYLMKKPMEYSSHEFVYLNIHNMFRKVLGRFFRALGRADADEARDSSKEFLLASQSVRVGPQDYDFRPKSLEDSSG